MRIWKPCKPFWPRFPASPASAGAGIGVGPVVADRNATVDFGPEFRRGVTLGGPSGAGAQCGEASTAIAALCPPMPETAPPR